MYPSIRGRFDWQETSVVKRSWAVPFTSRAQRHAQTYIAHTHTHIRCAMMCAVRPLPSTRNPSIPEMCWLCISRCEQIYQIDLQPRKKMTYRYTMIYPIYIYNIHILNTLQRPPLPFPSRLGPDILDCYTAELVLSRQKYVKRQFCKLFVKSLCPKLPCIALPSTLSRAPKQHFCMLCITCLDSWWNLRHEEPVRKNNVKRCCKPGTSWDHQRMKQGEPENPRANR